MSFDGRIRADARSLPLADSSVQCVITSPPYFSLRNYGHADQIGLESTPDEFVAALVGVFAEVWRVLRPDGTLWMNLGDTYAGAWGAQSRENPGPQGTSTLTGSSMLPARQMSGHLKPVHGGSQKNTPGLKPKDLIGIPWKVALALQEKGWYLRSDIIWNKPNPMPESVTDRPTRCHEYLFLLTKSERYYYCANAIKEACSVAPPVDRYQGEFLGDMGDHVSRGYPSANKSWRGSRFDDGKNLENHPDVGKRKTGALDKDNGQRRIVENVAKARAAGAAHDNPFGESRNKRSVWTVPTAQFPGSHYATFPPALIEPCVLAGSKTGDFILDPFAGSGTVAMVAEKHGRRGISVDLGYQELQGQRLQNIQPFLQEQQA